MLTYFLLKSYNLMTVNNKIRDGWQIKKWLQRLVIAFFILIVLIYLYLDGREFTYFINPLPSDEIMIAHFQTHRQEFETLAKNFRDFKPTPEETNFYKSPENNILRKKASIRWVSEAGATWFSDPYTAEGAKRFEILRKSAGIHGLEFVHKFTSIEFTLEDQPVGRTFRSAYLPFSRQAGFFPSYASRSITKDYMYFPEIPKIENGRLWFPVTSSGNYARSARAYSSINSYPFNWKIGECVYRQFESHWFLLMCITY